MLFDMVVARLGALAVVETASGETQFSLYRREGPESDAIIPWPLLRLGVKGRLSTVVMLSAPPGTPEEPPPRPGKAPRLRNLGPGEIVLHDGPHDITVTYGDDGRWMETARSRGEDAHIAVIEALARGDAQPTELLAAYIESLDLARHGPARVLRPAPLPGGVGSAWTCGLHAIRDALFDERIPPDATGALADGFSGAAVAFGASREEARAAWEKLIARDQPKPHLPERPKAPEPDSVVRTEDTPGIFSAHVRVTGPTPDVPWPPFVPENTPAVLIPLPRCHHPPQEWGSWVRLLGPHGETTFALLRRTLDGCILVGERLVGMLDLEEIEDVLDRADVLSGMPLEPRRDWPAHLPSLNSITATYRFVDEDSHEPVEPRVTGVRQTHGFLTRELDGTPLQWQVIRQRWVQE
jgi:hypothetical protein